MQSKSTCIFKAILFCIVFTGLLVVFSFAKSFVPAKFERLAHGIAGTLAAGFSTFIFLRFERKRFADIGLVFKQSAPVKFFAGVAAGIIIMGSLTMSVIVFSDVIIEVNSGSNVLFFLWATLPLLLLAFMEELGFRGYPLEILKDKIGIRLSILITSVLFALYHIANGWTISSSFYGPAVWGLLFGLSAVYSKGIAMPTGIHYGANLTTSAFGAKNYEAVSLWTVKQSHTDKANAGGTELTTILPALALLIFAVICIELYMRREKRFRTDK